MRPAGARCRALALALLAVILTDLTDLTAVPREDGLQQASP
jgi:hypothetical protein